MNQILNWRVLAWGSRAALSVTLVLLFPVAGHAASPNDLLSGYSAKAGSSPQPSQGQEFFTQRHGREWSCASCHGQVPTQTGKHVATDKSIGPMAPAFNPERFTNAGKTEKWFWRNCNDVVGRECTAAEKANVLSWLLTLRP